MERMRMASSPSSQLPLASLHNLHLVSREEGGGGGGQYIPTMPKSAVKMLSIKVLEKLEMAVPQPRSSAAAAGEGHVGSVTNAGVVAL